MKKRIAVSALAISPQPSGGKTFLLNLLEELVKLARDDFIFYILCSKDNRRIFEDRIVGSNVKIIALPCSSASPLLRIFLEQFFVLIWGIFMKIDLFYAPRNIIPLLATCPTVVSIHSMHLNYKQYDMPWWRDLYGQLILKLSARRAKAYLAVSEYAGRTYVEMYDLSPERLFVSMEGFRSTVLEEKSVDMNLTASENLLFVSTLFPHKNVEFLLRVFAKIANIRPSTNLIVVGRDVQGVLAKLRALAEKLSITQRIQFMGSVTDDELAYLYSQARVFVFPSLIEGFGLPVLEAMAYSVPVVASDRTSIPEVVGDAGIILDPEDEQAWVDAILRILDNEDLHAELSVRSRERAKEFTWLHAAEVTLECFNWVLESDVR